MAAEAKSNRAVILVVDNEVVTRNLVANLLHRDGHIVLAAANGREALELSRTYPSRIHLLITDTAMPRMGGLELSEHIQRERPGIRVLLLCARPSDEIAAGGMWQCLHKPVDESLLRRAVEEMLTGL
jgi:two-component system, response regulator